MKKLVRRLLMVILVPIIVIVLVLGYLGFVPGLSALFGSDTPVDLGAAYTEADKNSANQKFGQEFTAVSSSTDPFALIRAGQASSVNNSFTQQEVAAHIEETHPVSDVQVVFHDDGTFEASGRIDKSRITGFLASLGFEHIDEAGVLEAINTYVPGNPPFYLQGTGFVTEDKATLDLSEAKIGKLPLAAGPFADGLVAYANAIMEQVPYFEADSIVVENGQLTYHGTAPAVVPQY